MIEGDYIREGQREREREIERKEKTEKGRGIGIDNSKKGVKKVKNIKKKKKV